VVEVELADIMVVDNPWSVVGVSLDGALAVDFG
jgi:hypothetical protein